MQKGTKRAQKPSRCNLQILHLSEKQKVTSEGQGGTPIVTSALLYRLSYVGVQHLFTKKPLRAQSVLTDSENRRTREWPPFSNDFTNILHQADFYEAALADLQGVAVFGVVGHAGVADAVDGNGALIDEAPGFGF